MSKDINLSATALELFNKCACCFYNDRKLKKARPRGLFPSLPGGMDIIIKDHFDSTRVNADKHPLLAGIPELANFDLFSDAETLKAWRQWNAKKALRVQGDGWQLIGGVDEMLHSINLDCYAPLDNKTAGSGKRTQAEAEEYHKTQLDIYALMLSHCGYKPADFGVILIWSPSAIYTRSSVQFDVKPFIIQTSVKRAQDLITNALLCLASKDVPLSDPKCEYCKFVAERMPKEEAHITT